MGRVIRNVLVSAAAVIVFAGAGFAIGSTGFRWNQFFKDGYWGFSSHQWGILTSGSVGAAVALLGVVVTLTWQRRQFFEEQRIVEEREKDDRVRSAVDRLRVLLASIAAIIAAGDPRDRSAEVSQFFNELRGVSGKLFELDEEGLALVAIDMMYIAPHLANEKVTPLVDMKRYGDVLRGFNSIDVSLSYWNIDGGNRRQKFLVSIGESVKELAKEARAIGANIHISSDV